MVKGSQPKGNYKKDMARNESSKREIVKGGRTDIDCPDPLNRPALTDYYTFTVKDSISS